MEPKSDGSRTTRVLVIAACFVIVVAGMKAAAAILVPCLLAVFIVVILISLIFWGWVLGPVGMLLSVPLTMALKIALEDGDETRWIALMMGSAASGQAATSADQGTPDRDSREEGSPESS